LFPLDVTSGRGNARRRILSRAQHPATFHEPSFMRVSRSYHERNRTMGSLGPGNPLRGHVPAGTRSSCAVGGIGESQTLSERIEKVALLWSLGGVIVVGLLVGRAVSASSSMYHPEPRAEVDHSHVVPAERYAAVPRVARTYERVSEIPTSSTESTATAPARSIPDTTRCWTASTTITAPTATYACHRPISRTGCTTARGGR
jgi:hypothetical protein